MPGNANDPAMDRPPYAAIGPDQAQELMAAGALVVDVRQPEEWRTGHIAGAQLMPISGIYQFSRAARNLPQDRDVIFVCEAGQRSATASEIALVVGLAPERVYNLMGGMGLWRRRQLPVER